MTTDIALSGNDVVVSHESRLQSLEQIAKLIGEAFPHLKDALGAEREPHQFTEDEMSGLQFDPRRGTVEGLQRDNEEIRDMLGKLLSQQGLASGHTAVIPGSAAPERGTSW
jgi:hypothetical protein